MLMADEGDPGRPGPGEVAAAGGRDDAPSGPHRADGGRTELDGVVRTLGRRARRTNQSRAAQLCTALSRAETGGLDPAARVQAAELAHQLVGSAGTFGFVAASELAGELESFFVVGVFDEPRLEAARRQLDALGDQLDGEPSD